MTLRELLDKTPPGPWRVVPSIPGHKEFIRAADGKTVVTECRSSEVAQLAALAPVMAALLNDAEPLFREIAGQSCVHLTGALGIDFPPAGSPHERMTGMSVTTAGAEIFTYEDCLPCLARALLARYGSLGEEET